MFSLCKYSCSRPIALLIITFRSVVITPVHPTGHVKAFATAQRGFTMASQRELLQIADELLHTLTTRLEDGDGWGWMGGDEKRGWDVELPRAMTVRRWGIQLRFATRDARLRLSGSIRRCQAVWAVLVSQGCNGRFPGRSD